MEKGILCTVDPKKGRSLDEVIINLVKEFYCNDEFSRQMPGKKDFVSVSRNVHIFYLFIYLFFIYCRLFFTPQLMLGFLGRHH